MPRLLENSSEAASEERPRHDLVQASTSTYEKRPEPA
jgi:hypothetical protein